jgi:hypothetical protein
VSGSGRSPVHSIGLKSAGGRKRLSAIAPPPRIRRANGQQPNQCAAIVLAACALIALVDLRVGPIDRGGSKRNLQGRLLHAARSPEACCKRELTDHDESSVLETPRLKIFSVQPLTKGLQIGTTVCTNRNLPVVSVCNFQRRFHRMPRRNSKNKNSSPGNAVGADQKYWYVLRRNLRLQQTLRRSDARISGLSRSDGPCRLISEGIVWIVAKSPDRGFTRRVAHVSVGLRRNVRSPDRRGVKFDRDYRAMAEDAADNIVIVASIGSPFCGQAGAH